MNAVHLRKCVSTGQLANCGNVAPSGAKKALESAKNPAPKCVA
jgi:hypothetical protein